MLKDFEPYVSKRFRNRSSTNVLMEESSGAGADLYFDLLQNPDLNVSLTLSSSGAFSIKISIGASILRKSCLDHIIFPAIGGISLAMIGSSRYF